MKLAPYSKADSEGWARVTVTLACYGFHGDFIAWLQVEDIRRFEAELLSMYRKIGNPSTARLCSREPDIHVELESDVRGHITGSYRLESERRNGTPTVLSGGFEMDQSFIPGLTQQLHELALALTA